MSWLFGIIGSGIHDAHHERYRSIHERALHHFYQQSKFYFAVGGIQRTCFASERFSANGSFWLALGCRAEVSESSGKFLLNGQWGTSTVKAGSDETINGHFITYENNKFEFSIDRLGLRTLYWSRKDDEIVVSTRLDWISQYVGGCRIDYQRLGSRWLLYNQLLYDSLVQNIHRLGPGGRLIIHNNTVQQTHQAFRPNPSVKFSREKAIHLLESLLSPSLHEQTKITFGLSGGLDSRTLLSLLLKMKNENFQTHTFGRISDPDIFVPKMIAEKECFTNISYDAPLPSIQELPSILEKYVAETNLVEPVSTVLRLRHYSALDSNSFIMIDGGFGEVARRQYLNRLAIQGKKPIKDKNVEVILKNLNTHRANIFTEDIVRQMKLGIRDEAARMLDAMPDVEESGLENYLDLWAVRTRFPNFGSDEQARLDSFILNYMPFAQPSFIDMVFAMPVDLRINGRFFKQIIRNNHPQLMKYPLVKSGMTYPFYFPTKATWVLTKIKSKLGYQYSENHVHTFLEIMKEYIFDLLLSQNVKEYVPYDYKKILTSIEGYYAGNKAKANEVNWWLTFELWRRNIERK